jgi:leucyl aminopeptidase
VQDDAVVVLPYFFRDELDDVPEVRRRGGQALDAMLTRREPRKKRYQVSLLPPSEGRPGFLLVGAEERDRFDGFYLLRVAATAARYLSRRGYASIAVVDRGGTSAFQFGQASAQGIVQGAYFAALKKTELEEEDVVTATTSLVLVSAHGSLQEIERGAGFGQVVGETTNVARNLVNLPPNELTPSSFAERARALGEKEGVEWEVLDEAAMQDLGMGSLLGVAAGSQQPPRLIVLRYGDRGAGTKLALVGKGLTFDSGGLSLKTAEGMETMKGDMGGGAAVVAGVLAVARLGLDSLSITGYVGATENMPGGSAMRPGDVLTAMNGETIEVLNTDAEGRLVLADVLAYAVQQGATHIVDFATLTGAAMVALGRDVSLATGRPSEWVTRVARAASDGLERAWPMPLFPEYRDAMDSILADIKNTGGRYGGALNAAAFLGDFVDGVPWAHLDIAGTSWQDETKAYAPKGGTGAGVGTIASLVRQMTPAPSPPSSSRGEGE